MNIKTFKSIFWFVIAVCAFVDFCVIGVRGIVAIKEQFIREGMTQSQNQMSAQIIKAINQAGKIVLKFKSEDGKIQEIVLVPQVQSKVSNKTDSHN